MINLGFSKVIELKINKNCGFPRDKPTKKKNKNILFIHPIILINVNSCFSKLFI
jgi:hypothetical protein